MKTNVKTILLVVAILAIAAAAYGWFFVYNKPHKNIEGAKTDFKFTAEAFVKEFETSNVDSAEKKYLDKVIEVSGKVERVEAGDSISNVIFKVGDMYEIYFETYPEHNAEAKALKPGQETTIKAIFADAEAPDAELELNGALKLRKCSFVKQDKE